MVLLGNFNPSVVISGIYLFWATVSIFWKSLCFPQNYKSKKSSNFDHQKSLEIFTVSVQKMLSAAQFKNDMKFSPSISMKQ